jgi:O-methyltransferase
MNRLNYWVDQITSEQVSGWVFVPDNQITVQVMVNGYPVGEAVCGLPRPDVKQTFPSVSESLLSGFGYYFNPKDFAGVRGGTADIAVSIQANGKELAVTSSVSVPCFAITGVNAEKAQSLRSLLLQSNPAPLPVQVLQILSELRGEMAYVGKSWSDDLINSAIDDLVFLVQRGPKTLYPLYSYLGYLARTWSHCLFVEQNFPNINLARTPNQKDSLGIASSAIEIFAIAHYLFVLKSYGIQGDLAEFGCFKGFSTSCLSYACQELDIKMDVFDSFAGLPSSEDTYYQPGDFMGSFEEVSGNVSAFGKIDSICFHKGFFSDSLPHFHVPEIACIWMDVDLQSSSSDVMTVFPRLSSHSCVFSHECFPENFVDGRVVANPGPHAVIVPILSAFSKAGRQVTGCFISGYTGAFWDPRIGIPALAISPLMRLRDLALPVVMHG